MDAAPAERKTIVGLTAAFEGGLLALALLLGWLLGTWPFARLEASWSMFGGGLGIGLVLSLAAVAAARLSWNPVFRLWQLLEEIVGSLFGRCTVLDLALVSVLAGIAEEAFFRGFLQTALATVMDPLSALAVSGVAFGLAHFVSLGYAVAAALIGLFLGWLLFYFDNLLVPMTAHAVYDFVVLTYLVHVRGVRLRPAPE